MKRTFICQCNVIYFEKYNMRNVRQYLFLYGLLHDLPRFSLQPSEATEADLDAGQQSTVSNLAVYFVLMYLFMSSKKLTTVTKNNNDKVVCTGSHQTLMRAQVVCASIDLVNNKCLVFDVNVSN